MPQIHQALPEGSPLRMPIAGPLETIEFYNEITPHPAVARWVSGGAPGVHLQVWCAVLRRLRAGASFVTDYDVAADRRPLLALRAATCMLDELVRRGVLERVQDEGPWACYRPLGWRVAA